MGARTATRIDHLEGHLHIGDIGGHPGDDAGGGEFIDVREGEVLHIVVHILAQILGKASRGLCRKASRKHTQCQRRQAGKHQLEPDFIDIIHIAGGDAKVDEMGDEHGDHYIHRHLCHNQDRCKNRIPLVLPDTFAQFCNRVRHSWIIPSFSRSEPVFPMYAEACR